MKPKTWTPCQPRAIQQKKEVHPVASGREARRSRSQLGRTMSTPPPRAGQTAADLTGRAAGRDRAGPQGTAGRAAARPAQHRHHGRVNPEETSVVRSSGVMALGTLASRGSGFLRTLVLAYALGVSAGVSAAYNNANTLPNAVYDLMLGGILT